jgi:hypothetical protein
MIQKTTAYEVSGVTHATIAAAKIAAIISLFPTGDDGVPNREQTIAYIVECSDAVIEILKLKERKSRTRTAKPKPVKPTKKPATQAA